MNVEDTSLSYMSVNQSGSFAPRDVQEYKKRRQKFPLVTYTCILVCHLSSPITDRNVYLCMLYVFTAFHQRAQASRLKIVVA